MVLGVFLSWTDLLLLRTTTLPLMWMMRNEHVCVVGEDVREGKHHLMYHKQYGLE